MTTVYGFQGPAKVEVRREKSYANQEDEKFLPRNFPFTAEPPVGAQGRPEASSEPEEALERAG